MEIEFRRETDAAYLVITEEAPYIGYEARMLRECRVPAVLPLRSGPAGDRPEYVYEISGARSLEAMFAAREMRAEEIRALMQNLYQAVCGLNNCLLDPNCLFLEPGLIFFGKNGWCFLAHPPRDEDMYKQIQVLSRYILRKADHDDAETADMAYRLFDVCHSGDNYTFTQIFETIDCAMPAEEDADGTDEHSAGTDKPAHGLGAFLKSLFFTND